ncbi:MAG: type I methionyl aminopeptidase [Chloroflexi bacterium]|nr:type I methionyl aminopeptidase [Chloroflexota bacterium]
MPIILKSRQEIALMRDAGRLLAEVCGLLVAKVRPGITTEDLDRHVERLIRERGAIPSFKGYRGYPASVCVSVNEQVVHGIPGKRILREGDIVGLDLGLIHRAYQADMAVTVGVGQIAPEAQRLIDATAGALQAGIDAAREGNHVGDIGAAIQQHAEAHGYSVVREYVGHGIGRQMHEDPQVPNYGRPGQGPKLRRGIVLALEPMVNMGDWRTRVEPDQWTVVTLDGSLSAHFEHTIALTDDGTQILTRP